MKKSEFIQQLNLIPEDFEIAFQHGDAEKSGEHSEMYIENVIVNHNHEYILITISYTNEINHP